MPLQIRPLAPDEHLLWLEPGPLPEGASLPTPEKWPEVPSLLVAIDHGRCVARLWGRYHDHETFVIRQIIFAPSAERAELLTAFIRHLADTFRSREVMILTWDRDDRHELNTALLGGGFAIDKKKAFVEKSLAGYQMPYDAIIRWRTLREAGEEEFIATMVVAAEGDPFQNMAGRDPRSDFNELASEAGSRFNPDAWRIGYIEGEKIGVMLPQIYDDIDTEGTLFYIGVLPDQRGRGYGRRLHAEGLAWLAAHGVTRYVGSTDTRNAPMLAVFAANDCRQTTTQLFLRAVR